jgi:hypothetical protein
LVVVTDVGAAAGIDCWLELCSVVVVRVTGAGELHALASVAAASSAATGNAHPLTMGSNVAVLLVIVFVPSLVAPAAQAAAGWHTLLFGGGRALRPC